MKKKKLVLLIFEELLLTGLFLCVFALFHHVLPRMGLLTQTSEPVVISPVESAEVTDEAQIPWREKFSEHFSAEPVLTENSYSSPQVSITISTHSQELDGYPQTWYVADIYVAQVQNFQTYAREGSFERYLSAPAEDIAQMAGALISINGDYCNAQVQYGFYVRNGVMYQDEQTTCDICVLYDDGVMKTYAPDEYTVEDIVAKSPYQVWKFGPELLDDERIKQKISRCRELLDENGDFAAAIEKIDLFEPLHERMLRVGTETGHTDQVLANLADQHDQEVTEEIESMAANIEPILVAVLTVVIGGILLAVMLPLAGILTTLG